jgi:hypothetical protein
LKNNTKITDFLCRKRLGCGKGREEKNWEEKLDGEMSRCLRLRIAKWKKSEWKVGMDVSMCVKPVYSFIVGYISQVSQPTTLFYEK